MSNPSLGLSEVLSSLSFPSIVTNRGFYMSAHGLLNLLNGLGNRDKCEACRAFYLFFAMSLINSIIQEHKC